MNEKLYQKTGLIVSQLAMELLGKQKADRITPISSYQEKFESSRGTIQNAFGFLKEKKAISLKNKGHLGTYIEDIDYEILQQLCVKDTLLGIMPLPYSRMYEGMASAFYTEFKKSVMNFNLAYIRGAEARIKLIVSKAYDFAVCSKYAANRAIEKGYPIKIAIDFGEESYLSKHVLVLQDKSLNGIYDNMRIGIDRNSFDQCNLTYVLTEGKNVELVDTYSHQIISAIRSNKIDAGIWNLDEIVEKGYVDLHYVMLDDINTNEYSSAVLVVYADAYAVEQTLLQYIHIDEVRAIQKKVKDGELIPSY